MSVKPLSFSSIDLRMRASMFSSWGVWDDVFNDNPAGPVQCCNCLIVTRRGPLEFQFPNRSVSLERSSHASYWIWSKMLKIGM
jgi:hypothetical protein